MSDLQDKRLNDFNEKLKSIGLAVKATDPSKEHEDVNFSGWFHVIEVYSMILNRKGIILERHCGKTYAAHLILGVSGRKKQKFFKYFSDDETLDFPYYWVKFSWYRREDNIFRKIFGAFDILSGLNASSFYSSIKKIFFKFEL